MDFSKINLFCACVVGLALIVPVYNAPRTRSKGHSTTTYDQHQAGDYNVQVRLKDFRIIALLGGDPWGGSGDLDYNYDYSDLTIKPIVSITTEHPQDSTTSHSSETTEEAQKPDNGTHNEKPSEHPYPMVTPLTTVDNSEKSTTLQLVQSSTTSQPQSSTTPLSAISVSIVTSESEPPQMAIIKTENVASSTQKAVEDPQKSSTTVKNEQVPQKSTKLNNSEMVPEEAHEKKTESSVTNISIVPSESNTPTQSDHHVPLGEIMHYRKCAEGYGKDKLGRCRKIFRTPQLPYGITRFASNLASRIRQAASGSRSAPEVN